MDPLSAAFAGALTSLLGVFAARRFLPAAGRDIARAPESPALAKAMRALAEEGAHVRIDPAVASEDLRNAADFNAMARAVEERERSLRQIAQTDAETGLLTRLALETVLDDLPDPDRRPMFVAALRIERFPTLRQNIGYTLASSLLRELGQRARRAVPGARVGQLSTATIGIGFPAANVAEAVAWIGAVRTSLESELDVAGHLLDIGCIIGFATSEGAGSRAGTLIEQAELAVDQAEHSRSRLAMFRIDKFGDPSERLALMRDLRGALRNGDIFLCYQPKLRARTDEIDAIEALIRWRHPSRGMIPPDQFIALAEEMGEIRAVTEWVLRQAARDQARLAAAGMPLTVYVNISGRLLGDSQFAECALLLAREFVCQVGFEITETSVIFDPEGALRDLTAFAAAGIRIAIDDYGSGWSSLAYLRKLPADELKIDRMFISDLTSSHRDPLLVRSTIDLAHALGLEVTAEGVDQPSALALLRVMGCDVIQGFLVAPPMTVDELETFLREHRHLANIDVEASASSASATSQWWRLGNDAGLAAR